VSQERPNRWAEWVLIVRERVPILRARLVEWAGACREEPVLLWHTPAVRYGLYLIGLLIVAWSATWIVRAAAPAPPTGAKERADTADFHVVCTSPSCGEHFVIHRRFGFDDFPVPCPACKQKTGSAARLCASSTCRGRWVVPIPRGDAIICPHCGEPFATGR
jgi:hypothetical protein